MADSNARAMWKRETPEWMAMSSSVIGRPWLLSMNQMALPARHMLTLLQRVVSMAGLEMARLIEIAVYKKKMRSVGG